MTTGSKFTKSVKQCEKCTCISSDHYQNSCEVLEGLDELRLHGTYSLYMFEILKFEKDSFKIYAKTHAYLQTIIKTIVKFGQTCRRSCALLLEHCCSIRV